MNELALFAGAGGGLLGSRLLGWRSICYVEQNKYAVDVLKARIKDKCLDDAPIWDDVRTFDGRPWAGLVDVITAGFPCQPWSTAGKRLGELDERNLWPDTIRIIREVKPRWCLLENVANLLSRLYIQQIFWDLAESGYDARWECISAAAVGAPHIRNRVWIVANASGIQGGLRVQQRKENAEIIRSGKEFSDSDYQYDDGRGYGGCKDVRAGKEKTISNTQYNPVLHNQQSDIQNANSGRVTWWDVEPELGRVAHGVARRVDRLTAIGNGQVPAVVRAAWCKLNVP